MANANNGYFVWYEHFTRDAKAAIAFYGDVCGWTTQPFGEGNDYAMWVNSQGPFGGVMQPPVEDAPMGWYAHVQVQDVDASVALALKLGGKVIREAGSVPGVGRFGFVSDPQGAAVSFFTPEKEAPLADMSKEGTFCWSELLTSDSAAAWSFYSEVLGWKTVQEMDMGPAGIYRLYGVSEKALGGMMTVPGGGLRPQWLFYVETSDLDAAIGRATARGAKVMNGPMPVPDGGRIAQLTDPQGSWFALHQQAKV